MTPGTTDVWTLMTIAGLACVTVLARSFFFISRSERKLPHWAERGLQYAPIAALAAVIIPEIVVSQGALISTLKDARLYGAASVSLSKKYCRISGRMYSSKNRKCPITG